MSASSPPSLRSESKIPAHRLPRACEVCRARKVKCSGDQPCTNCQSAGNVCVFRAKARQRFKQIQISANHSHLRARSLAPPASHALNCPLLHKKQCELRRGLTVPNPTKSTFQFYGPSSHIAFVQRIRQRLSHQKDDRVAKWNFQPFIFSPEKENKDVNARVTGGFLSAAWGHKMIAAYFELIHPRAPILDCARISAAQEELWRAPVYRAGFIPPDHRLTLLIMAIGAHILVSAAEKDAPFLEQWSRALTEQANEGLDPFYDPTVEGTQYIFLKGILAEQQMKNNDSYMYFGHAARCALALGLNRAEVVQEAGRDSANLELTFWSIYVHERFCALLTGRPSSLRDSQIDIPFPETLASHPASRQCSGTTVPMPGVNSSSESNYHWLQAMVQLAVIADKILVFLSSPRTLTNPSDLGRIASELQQCTSALDTILFTTRLPAYLHFYDPTVVIGSLWQEIQRTQLGLSFYLVQSLLHRPALIFSTMFATKTEADDATHQWLDIQSASTACLVASSSLVQLAHDAHFVRCPVIRNDSSMVTFIVYACVTVLYDVLDLSTTVERARGSFRTVERAMQCLDQVVNIGTTTGKTINADLMRVAKRAWEAAGHHLSEGENSLEEKGLIDDFPWLGDSDQISCDPFSEGWLTSIFSGHNDPLLTTLMTPTSLPAIPTTDDYGHTMPATLP